MARSGPYRASAVAARTRIRDVTKSIWKITQEKAKKGLRAVKKLPPRKTKKRETRKPLKKFRFFMDLPAEIRLIIWKKIETRLDLYHHVHIHAIRVFPNQDRSFKSKTFNSDTRFPSFCGHEPLWSGRSGGIPKGGVFLSTNAPPIHPFLHACFESRDFLIRKHKLMYAFGAFINPDRDIIYLTSSPTFRGFWPGAIGIAVFAQFLRKTKLNRKMKKFAINVGYEFRNQRDIIISTYAGVMKHQLFELKKLYMVQERLLRRQKRWSPSNHILFAVIPPHYQSRTQRRNQENSWTHVGPPVTPAVLYEHVAAWEPRPPHVPSPTKNHGVWSAANYFEALRLLARGKKLRDFDPGVCCNKSINQQD
jgi:hypothetical protein